MVIHALLDVSWFPLAEMICLTNFFPLKTETSALEKLKHCIPLSLIETEKIDLLSVAMV